MIERVFAAPKGPSPPEGIEFARTHNLGYEIPSFYYVENLDDRENQIQLYHEWLADFKGVLSMHGPIFDTNVVSLDPEILKISQHRYHQAIEIAHALNVKYLVFHSQWTPIYTVANATEAWQNKVVDFWNRLLDESLQDSNLVILIENFLDQDPTVMESLLSRVNSPQLKCCLDIGHVNLFSKIGPIDWMRALEDQVVYIHAHNNAGKLDSHNSFEVGSINLPAFLNHIALTPNKVQVAIETSSMVGLNQSYHMIRPYLTLQKEQYASKSFLI